MFALQFYVLYKIKYYMIATTIKLMSKKFNSLATKIYHAKLLIANVEGTSRWAH